ncbi:sugar-binding protein [Microbacterium sp. NM3R9]|uniref:sugar-binding protein n=1 Tax=Microbacterium thalli TaxID=3027921 RepID=UPI0023661BB6|nr:sugar-binding protein [Microbacterium thalli]MDN8547935.1 sugar-binding protein [Microbacterium thalli]
MPHHPLTPLRSLPRRTAAGTALALALGGALAAPASAAAPELSITSQAWGNLFHDGDAVSIRYETSAAAITWRVVDGWGEVVDDGSEPSDGTLSPNVTDTGWYRLEVTATGDGRTSAATTFAILPDTDAAASATGRFGAATHYGQSWDPASMQALTAGGFAQLRDEIYWSEVETQPGIYDWSRARAEFLDSARAQGIRPLLLAGYGNPLYDAGNGPVSPDAVAAYADYAAAMAAEFGDMSTGIEVWNEWDLGLGGNTNVSPEHYVALLAAASPAIEAAAPGLPVIGPAVANLNTDWLERTFQLGALEHLDGIVLHPYSYPVGADALDETLTRIDALVRRYNDGESLPLWITEHGWPTGTNARAVTERQQAADIAKSAVIAAAHDAERYYVYDLVNDGVVDAETEQNFGLLHHPDDALGAFTPKPSFAAYAVAADALASATFAGRDDPLPGLRHLRFDTADGPLHVLWSDAARTISLEVAGSAEITTMFGAAETVSGGSGAPVLAHVGTEPLYVHGDVTAIGQTAAALTLDPAVAGSPVAGTWTVQGRPDAASAWRLVLADGTEAAQTTEPGATASTSVTVPAAATAGAYETSARVFEGDRYAGTLRATTTVREPVTLQAAQALTADGASVLRVRVANASATPRALTSLSYVVGATSAQLSAPTTIDADADVVIDVPLDELTEPAAFTATAVVDGSTLTASGRVAPVDAASVQPATHRTITVDGTLDDLGGVAPIAFAANGDADDADQSARAWLTWDEEYLYLSADVADDVHDQPAQGANIWQGDSIQFTVAGGAPGAATTWHEFGMALTSAGPQLYRWLSVDAGAGPVPGAPVAISRDDDTGRTVYETAIPWSLLRGVDPTTSLLSSAAIVNEADGAGRAGFLSWGGGIAGEKDSGQFTAVRLLAPTPVVEPPIEPTEPGVAGGSGSSAPGTATGGGTLSSATAAGTGDARALASTGGSSLLTWLGAAIAASVTAGGLLVMRRAARRS